MTSRDQGFGFSDLVMKAGQGDAGWRQGRVFGVVFQCFLCPSNFVGLMAVLCSVVVLPTQREAVKSNQLALCKSV